MTTRTRITAVLALVLTMAGTLALSGPTAAATVSCATTWGSLTKAAGGLSTAPITTSRTGQHDCYDSLVFEVDGAATGYLVEYAQEVYSQGRGDPLSPQVGGGFGALIGIHLYHPAYDIDTGLPTYTFVKPDFTGYQTFRGMAYGGSFEGYTTFALGVRARLPFQVLVLPGPGSHTRIVVNVAHRWTT